MKYIESGIILKAYLIAINLITYGAVALDKWKAIHGKWRIKEKTLIGLAAIGGSVGGLMAMYTFHHKTRHPKFVYGLPFILLVQLVILFLLDK